MSDAEIGKKSPAEIALLPGMDIRTGMVQSLVIVAGSLQCITALEEERARILTFTISLMSPVLFW